MKRTDMAFPDHIETPPLTWKEVAQMAVGVVIVLVFTFLFLAVLFVGGGSRV